MSTVISQRAAELADAFTQATDAIIASIEACTDTELLTPCDGEGWPVIVVAHHVAIAIPAIAGMAQSMASGQGFPPFSPAEQDARNAQHAIDAAHVTRSETLALLRANSTAAVTMIRSLSDEQLDRTAELEFLGGATWSAADLIERALIGHPAEHGQSIRDAISR